MKAEGCGLERLRKPLAPGGGIAEHALEVRIKRAQV